MLLSSYDLLELLEFMDEDGAFKTDMERGGRWPDWKQMLAESANEAYRFRSAYQLINSEDGCAQFATDDIEFIDPAVRVLREEAAEMDAEEASRAQRQFDADAGYS